MFSFQPDDINILRGYLHNTLKSRHNEFEIRFSTNKHDDLFAENAQAVTTQKPEKYRFSPVIEKGIFFRALSLFKQHNLPMEKIYSVDSMYDNYTRKTEIYDENNQLIRTFFIKKLKSKFNDLWDANLRLCLSMEEPVQERPMLEESTYIRRKDRTSFFDNCVRYDFTVVTTVKNNEVQKPTYEIEIEFIPAPAFSASQVNDTANHLAFCATHVMRVLQDSPSIMTLSEKHNIQLEYNVLINSSSGTQNSQQSQFIRQRQPKIRFIGAQPETLHKHHVGKIQSGNYSVTEKFDGERALLFISGNSELYILGRNFRFRSCGLTSCNDQGSLLDVELVNNTIFAFDILFYKGQDLRNQKDYNLKSRLSILQQVVSNLTMENQHKSNVFPVYTKEHFFSDLEDVFKRWLNNDYVDDIPRDGFIFTPINEPYPIKSKWANLLKWKPVEINSIDFLVKTTSNNDDNVQKWKLFVGDKDNITVPFEQCPVIYVDTQKYDFPSNMDNMIVECVWNFEDNTFVPMRWRQDKTNPNYKTIALDVWQSIQNPVLLTDLLSSPLHNMRKLHNQIKTRIINNSVFFKEKYESQKYPESSESERKKLDWAEDCDDELYDIQEEGEEDLDPPLRVLDLGCGRGGDLWKWISHTENRNVEYYGVDVNEEYLLEAQKRSLEIQETINARDKNKGQMKCTFVQCDLRIKEPVFFSVNTNSFDIVSCQFAMHYFYESENAFKNFLNILTKNLVPNGIFTTSLFDGYSVYDLCTKGYNKQNNNGTGFDITPLFDCRLGLHNIKSKEFNIGITAVLSGDSDVILKSETKEYLVFADLFIKRMTSNKFQLKECLKFNDVKIDSDIILSEIEQLYSQLHRYYIFVFNKKYMPMENSYWKRFPYDNECFHPLPVEKVLSEGFIKENGEENNMEIVDEKEQPMKLFIRICGCEIGCISHEHCLLTMLEIITGKTRKYTGNDKSINLIEYADSFNICINIISVSDNGTPDFLKQELFKPSLHLDDVKTVHFLLQKDHYHIIARECEEVCEKVLSFPSRIILDVDMSVDGDNSSSNEENKNLMQDMDIDIATKESTNVNEKEKNVLQRDMNDIEDIDTKMSQITVEESGQNIDKTDMFLNRSLKGKNSWTIKELQAHAATINIKIPSSIRKKEDIVTFLKNSIKLHNEAHVDINNVAV